MIDLYIWFLIKIIIIFFKYYCGKLQSSIFSKKFSGLTNPNALFYKTIVSITHYLINQLIPLELHIFRGPSWTALRIIDKLDPKRKHFKCRKQHMVTTYQFFPISLCVASHFWAISCNSTNLLIVCPRYVAKFCVFFFYRPHIRT